MNVLTIDLNKKNMPEWDVVKATPIRVPLDNDEIGKALIFNIPSVETYFDFEAYYTEILAKHFVVFSNVQFLTYEEFSDSKLKNAFFNELKKVMDKKEIKESFYKIIDKYFEADNFEMKKLLKIINPIQFAYCVMLIHNCVEFVKKKFLEMAPKVSPQVLGIFSTSGKDTSTKVGPRFC